MVPRAPAAVPGDLFQMQCWGAAGELLTQKLGAGPAICVLPSHLETDCDKAGVRLQGQQNSLNLGTSWAGKQRSMQRMMVTRQEDGKVSVNELPWPNQE